MKTLKILNAATALIALTACNASVPTSTETLSAQPQTVSTLSDVAPVPIATTQPTVNTVSLTYYSMTATRAPQGSYPSKTYTSKGSCVVYQSNTYCWDDGIKTIDLAIPHFASLFYYSYWNVGNWSNDGGQTVAGFSFNNGGSLVSDSMATPLLITHNVQISLNARAAPNTVLSSGVPTQVTCTETSGTLDCGDFSIDLNQPHL